MRKPNEKNSGSKQHRREERTEREQEEPKKRRFVDINERAESEATLDAQAFTKYLPLNPLTDAFKAKVKSFSEKLKQQKQQA